MIYTSLFKFHLVVGVKHFSFLALVFLSAFLKFEISVLCPNPLSFWALVLSRMNLLLGLRSIIEFSLDKKEKKVAHRRQKVLAGTGSERRKRGF